MAIYEIESERIRSIEPTSFDQAGLRERADLQRLLRSHIEVIAPNTLVIAEEFGEWDGSSRRIDLLGIDGDANLVVIELKRTEDGGHMELQAIRYAAMVSAMTFDAAAEAYSRYLQKTAGQNNGEAVDARQALLDFLNWEEPDEDLFAQDVRIVLASADFSKELTGSVLWLNERGLDIRCIRIKPYTDGQRTLIDVQQLIPLPEAQEYQVQIREKQREERRSRKRTRDTTKFDVTVREEELFNLPKRRAIFTVVKGLADAGVSPEEMKAAVSWRKRIFVDVEGEVHSGAAFARAYTEEAEAGGQDAMLDTKRVFMADDELIRASGRTYALTNQWGPRTEEAINQLLERWPDKGVSCRRSDAEGA